MEYDDVFMIESDLDELNSCLCSYCGCPTGNSDPDVLCPNCRATFGHTFYSEL